VLKRDDVAGKTGTTNDSVDVWFSGYTPALATTVWMGFDQPKSLGSTEFGAGLTLSAWLQYMQSALKGIPVAPKRPMPQDILTANGEYYLSEFPPGQSVASLDLPTEDPLGDFLNHGGTGGIPMMNPQQPDSSQPGSTQPGAPPSGSIFPAIPVPQVSDGRQPRPAPAPDTGAAGRAPAMPPIPVPRADVPRPATAMAVHP
jgi:penicillin-binding protein 1A